MQWGRPEWAASVLGGSGDSLVTIQESSDENEGKDRAPDVHEGVPYIPTKFMGGLVSRNL